MRAVRGRKWVRQPGRVHSSLACNVHERWLVQHDAQGIAERRGTDICASCRVPHAPVTATVAVVVAATATTTTIAATATAASAATAVAAVTSQVAYLPTHEAPMCSMKQAATANVPKFAWKH